ncbi:Rib/alpha-like domain-containing protein [Aerococcus urinae]|uniref:Rib/alpha-like domain-containing protein n=1 Tax=Aerococcus urinae TaxID=1376 RepID=UPI0021580C85|nr:Rib/alpha-like domain-containing protein [Aerococcus urinae]
MVGKNNLKVKKEKQSNKFYRYSIRRLSVGVASVAVAAGLLFASDSAVAQAATNEVKASAVETPSALAPVADPKPSEVVTAPVASPAEDKAAAKPVAEETKVAEEKVTPNNESHSAVAKSGLAFGPGLNAQDAIANAGQLPAGTTFSFEKQASKEDPTAVVLVTYPDGTSQRVNVVYTIAEEAKPAQPEANKKAEEKPAEKPAEAEKVEAKKAEEQPKADKSEDKKADKEAKANEKAEDNDQGEKAKADEKPQSEKAEGDKEAEKTKEKKAEKEVKADKKSDKIENRLAFYAAPENSATVTTDTEDKKFGDVKESTVAANAKNALHGFVGLQRSGDLNLLLGDATGQQFVPVQGIKVYFQWYEDGGYTSPVYTTTSGADGQIHLGLPAYLAPDGKFIQFDADTTVSAGHEKYRFWVDEDTIPKDYQLQYITGESVVYPGAALPITQGGASSDTTTNTHNNWKVLLMEKPKEVMHKAAKTSEAKQAGGFLEGKVAWDYESGVGGVQWNTVGQLTSPAPGITVRASYLSDYALKQIYSPETVARMGLKNVDAIRGGNWTNKLEEQLQNWIKEQVAKDPNKWIAETVETKTNAEGKYIIQFNGTWGPARNGKDVATYTRTPGYNFADAVTWTPDQVNRLHTVANSPAEGSFYTGLANYPNRKHINYDWLYVSTVNTDNLRVFTPYNNNQFTAMNGTWGINPGWSGTGFGVGVTNDTQNQLRADFALAPAEVKFNITNYDSGARTAIPGDVAETATTGLPYKDYTNDRFRIVWEDEKGNVVKTGAVQEPDGTGSLKSEPLDTDTVPGAPITKTTNFVAKLYRVDSNGKNADLIAQDNFTVEVNNHVGSKYDEVKFENPKPIDKAKYEAKGLPAGLKIDPNTGNVTGKPTEVGAFDVETKVTVQDPSGPVEGKRVYKYLITDSPLEDGAVGTEYNKTIIPTPIQGYVFKNVKGEFTKPVAGLTIKGNKITGTPTAKVAATEEAPNTKVTYDIYKLNDKGEEVLIKKGHVDNVPLSITAAKENASYDPVYNPAQANVGEEVTSTPTFIDQADKDTVKPEGAKFALGENAPEGAKVDPNTGVVTYTPKAADAGTMVSVPVVVTYKDGSQDTTNAPFIVAEQDKIKDVTDPNSPVPEGYVRLKFNADTKDGSVTGKFADNSKVKAFDVLKGTKFNAPEIQTKFDQVVPTNPVADNPAKKWSSWEPIFDNELAKDTPIEQGLKGDTREYHSVYEDKRFNEDNDGIAKVEIVQEPTKKEYTEDKEGDNKLDPTGTKVKLTDANGVEKVVEPKDFDKYGIKVGLKDVPNYTTDTPLTKKDHDGKKVEVTVPGKDGELKAESKAPIKVKQQEKDALEPSYEPTEANVGQAAKSKAPSFKDSANKPADTPAGATFALGEGAPKGATIDPKTGEVSYTPQAADEGKDVKIPVVVTYGDKTTDTAEATFNVGIRPDVYKPTDPNAPVPEGYHKVTLKAGEGTQVEEKVLHVRDGKAISTDSYPEATIDPAKAKDYKEPITWSVAPDTPISKDEVIVANATKKTDTEKNEPQAKDQTVKVGETPKAEDSIANLKDLPQGTKVAYKEPVDTKTPGEKPATVVVTYPDGSSEEVSAKVQVKDLTDAEKNDPQGQDINTKVGETPNAKDGIKDADKLPKGTTFDFKQPVDTKTPGDKPATVVVTYPDGTKDEVPVTVKVTKNPTQAETTDPTIPAKTEVEDKTNLTPEEKAEVKKKVEDANKDKFPAPKEGQNPTTVEVGSDGTATITYPDGSKDTIPGTDLVVERPKTSVEGTPKTVKPTKDPQDTGLVVKDQDDKTPTKVTAKDEDGQDVPVTVDPETGKVSVTPGPHVDGPITVTVEDKDLPDGKQTFEVPVEGHEAGRDDNGSDKTQADLTDPTVPAKTEVEDKTNLTPEEKAEVKKKVEDANKGKFPEAKPGQNPTTVEVGPDGTATITYPDGSKDTIPGTDLVVERPKTTVEGEPKTVKPTNDLQDTGLVVKNQDDKTPTKVTAKDEDGQDVPVTVDPETGKVSVTPGTNVDGPITVTVEDKDLLNGKQSFEVPVEGHEKGRDDNHSGKTQADLTDPTVPAEKTPVADKNHLTEDEKNNVKKAIEDANKDKFPAPKEGQNPTTVTVDDKGTATITYPDGSKDTIPGDQLVREKTNVDDTAVKAVNPTDEKQGTGVKVNNPDKDTKATAKDEDGKDVPVVINPETGEVEVTPGKNVDGPITVTVTDPDLPGGKKEVTVPVNGHKAGRDDNHSGKTQADLTDPTVPAEKTPVADKNHLTEDEKNNVKKAVEDANKDKFPAAKEGQNPTKVEIGNDGTATITYPDGSKDTIPGKDLVVERPKTTVEGTPKTVKPTNDSQDTGLVVKNKDDKTPTKVTAKDEDGQDVPVTVDPETGKVSVTPGTKVDGPITVTVEDKDLPEGKQSFEVPVEGHEKGRDDNGSDKTQADLTDPVVPAEKTPVADKTNLTQEEKDAVKKAIEDANKDKFPAAKEGQNPTKVEIGNDGTATITYPDGSKDTIPGDQLVREKTNVDDSVVTPVDPTDEKQGTGIKVNNPDKDTKVTAKDEDGKDVPVVINPETGDVEVTPGADVDGPITVTVEDPDLPGGKQEVTVPVKGHEAGRDDNGSDVPNTPSETVEKTTVDDSQVKEVNPTDDQQGTGIKVNNPDKDTKVTAKDEDGKNIPVVINPTTGEVEVTPGTDVDGPIIVTITDPELPGGKKVVVVPVKGHAAGRDDNGSDASPKPATPKPNTVKPGQSGHGNRVAQPVHTNTVVHAATTKANQPSANKASSAKVQSQLPQTGAVAGLASSLALALIGAGSILALGKRRKED